MYKIILLLCFSLKVFSVYSQVVTQCPANVGFESASFTGWQSYTGYVIGNTYRDASLPDGSVVVNPVVSSAGRQALIRRGSGKDEYGHFSLDSPNGSEYVVKLGNNNGGAEAERISYTLTVPSNVETYSIVFNYAVVFQAPNHSPEQNPKFTAKVFDVTTNSSTQCGSFEFQAPTRGGEIPGFEVSDVPGVSNSDVLYKSWSPVFVNLSDYIGHTIRLEFTTNDCVYRAHFGYAYIDFNENCSIPVTGNITCPEVDSITLKVIPGFYAYRWYNVETQETLGDSNNVVLFPVPAPGTKIGVELTPYAGLGCTQTIFTTITGIEMHINDPPPDCTLVDLTVISVTVGNSNDLVYTYWMDPAATKPIPDPRHISIGGRYYIRGQSSSGCLAIEPVNVTIIPPLEIPVLNPEPVVYPATVDITKAFVHEEGVAYTYWLDKDTTRALVNPTRVNRDGTYYIKGYIKDVNVKGCACVVPVTADIIYTDVVIPNTFTPNGDGINDVLTILMDSKVGIKFLKIYNRWGDAVFITADIYNYWDGLKEGAKVPAGVYYWVLEGQAGSEQYTRSGSVTVIR